MRFQVSAASDLFDGRAPYNGCALQAVARLTIASLELFRVGIPSKTHRTHSTAFSCPSSSRRLRAALTRATPMPQPHRSGTELPKSGASLCAARPTVANPQNESPSTATRVEGRAGSRLAKSYRAALSSARNPSRVVARQQVSDRRPVRHAHGTTPTRQRLQVPRAEYPILKTFLSLR